jgi:hypothetical protein
MLLQTNSYIVPKDRRAEHGRLMRRFRQVLAKLGCDMFEVYEQVGQNWQGGEDNRRCVQIIRFRDRKHQASVQNAERNDPAAQALIAEFCDLVNFPYQQQQGYFATGFYNSVLPIAPTRVRGGAEGGDDTAEAEGEVTAPPPAMEPEAPVEPPAVAAAAAVAGAAAAAQPPAMDEIFVQAVRVEESAISPEVATVAPEVVEAEVQSEADLPAESQPVASDAAEPHEPSDEPLEYGEMGEELPEEVGAPLSEEELLGELGPLTEPHGAQPIAHPTDGHEEAAPPDYAAEDVAEGANHDTPAHDDDHDDNREPTDEGHRPSLFRRRPQGAPNPSQTD